MGIAIGLIIGFALGKTWQNTTYYFQPYFNKDSNIVVNKDSLEIQKPDKTKIKPKKTPKKIKTKTVVIDSIITDSLNLHNDSILMDSLAIDTINEIENDSINELSNTGELSIIQDSINDSLNYVSIQIQNTSNGDIKLAKDELIYAIYAYPQGEKNDFLCSGKRKLDSLLTNNIRSKEEGGLYIEFWQSPINYTGYKLSNKSLVLFGFYEYKAIRLNYLPNGILQLQYHDQSFALKCTDVFIPLHLHQKTTD